MRTSLIQTYMNNLPQIAPDKDAKNLDIPYVLSNRTFIKPLPAGGQIVNNGILDLPSVVVKSSIYDIKSLKHAIKGNANDHELGKINDIGMKIGGLAIAGYLMTRKQTPILKAMELVGLASFFGAMSLWPKVALELPARLMHGFNIRKKYEDSFGRNKMFFQDPQYLPWDLVSDKDINKIGNYMNVPKDIPNRRDFVQEKMKKVAVQNNTLWMLTAGVATPIMSALMCNVVTKPLSDYLNKKVDKQAEKIPSTFSQFYPKFKNTEFMDRLEIIYEMNKDKAMTPELVNQIKTNFTEGLDKVTASALKEDLDFNILKLDERSFFINKTSIEDIILNSEKALENVVAANKIEKLLPEPNKLAKILNEYFNQPLEESNLKQIRWKIGQVIKNNIKEHNRNVNVEDLIDSETEKIILEKLFGGKAKSGVITSVLTRTQARKFDSTTMATLRHVGKMLVDLKAKNLALDEYAYMKVAEAPETTLAHLWNNTVGDFLKLFKFSSSEITNTRHDGKLMDELLRNKLEGISSNTEEYNHVIKEVCSKISKLESAMKTLDTSVASKESYASIVESVFNETALILKNSGLTETSKRLVGIFEKNPKEAISRNGSLKNIQLSYVTDRLAGARSSLYRLLNTIDIFRRISTLESIPGLHKGMPLEIKEELVELCKKMSVEGRISDFLTKFYVKRNPYPNLDDMSQIVVENGKVINKYVDAVDKGLKVDLPNDKSFFKDAINILFNNDIHPDTKTLIDQTVFSKEFDEYRRSCSSQLGDFLYFDKPEHLFHGLENAATHKSRFSLLGMTPSQMFSRSGKEAFNTNKWLKMFGGIGMGLLGVTVISQFFFGKLQNPERIKHD